MKRKMALFRLLLAGFLLTGCKSISRHNAEFNMPPSSVVFSFDDGPNVREDTTARLLDVLKKFHIHALFSLLGENIEAHPELVRRIYNEGHYFVNHGYSDRWANTMGKNEFHSNLERGDAAITAALGHNGYPKLYRPHGGYYNSEQEKICYEAGYIIVPASIRIFDAVLTERRKSKAFRQIIEKVKKKNGGIILLHDALESHSRMERKLKKHPHSIFDRSWLPELVEMIVTELLDKGYIMASPDFLIPKDF